MLVTLLVGCTENELATAGEPARAGPVAEESAVDPRIVAPDAGSPVPDRPPESGLALPAGFLFEDETLHRFDLVLSEDAEDALDGGEVVEATFRYGAEAWIVGLALKGSYSRRGMSEKAAFRIDFGEIVPDQEFYGLRRMTLNNMVQDGSMIREHVVYRAYAAVGVPAPRHAYAELWVNDELWGLYGVLDAMDRRFARWAFPEDGEGWLYEGGNGADLLAGRERRFHVQAEGEGEPHADVEALVAELDAADDVMDVIDRFDASVFRMWATDLASGNRDGYTRRRNNYHVYHGAGRWWFLPWGSDQALNGGSGLYDGFVGRMLVDCQRSGDCMDRLEAAMDDVADAWEAVDLPGYAAATGELVAEACARDPRREDPCRYEGVVELVEARLEQIRRD